MGRRTQVIAATVVVVAGAGTVVTSSAGGSARDRAPTETELLQAARRDGFGDAESPSVAWVADCLVERGEEASMDGPVLRWMPRDDDAMGACLRELGASVVDDPESIVGIDDTPVPTTYGRYSATTTS